MNEVARTIDFLIVGSIITVTIIMLLHVLVDASVPRRDDRQQYRNRYRANMGKIAIERARARRGETVPWEPIAYLETKAA